MIADAESLLARSTDATETPYFCAIAHRVSPGRTVWVFLRVVLAAFVAAIAVGEMLRVRMPSGRIASPVSSGSAIGLAVLGPMDGHSLFDVPAGVVTQAPPVDHDAIRLALLVAGLGMGLGLLVVVTRAVIPMGHRRGWRAGRDD